MRGNTFDFRLITASPNLIFYGLLLLIYFIGSDLGLLSKLRSKLGILFIKIRFWYLLLFFVNFKPIVKFDVGLFLSPHTKFP